MLQPPRNESSKSFLREASECLVLIPNDKDRNYFLKEINKVIEKRENPNITLTGAKDIKKQLLVYLQQKGKVETANVWARNLVIQREAIDNLKESLTQILLENNIQGVLEIHLQDREINSPHIQFVGNDCSRAEILIAQELVRLQYESSMQSALSKNIIVPYYEDNPNAPIHSLQDALNDNNTFVQQQTYLENENLSTTIHTDLTNALNTLKTFKDNITDSLNNTLSQLQSNIKELISTLKNKQNPKIKRLLRRKKKK